MSTRDILEARPSPKKKMISTRKSAGNISVHELIFVSSETAPDRSHASAWNISVRFLLKSTLRFETEHAATNHVHLKQRRRS